MAIENRYKISLFILQQCCLLLVISSPLVSSIKFGLISPIEVVEEWGCQNTEIRLTCSNLDSTIAILEATFKPNCSGRASNANRNGNVTEADDNCVHFDLNRLTPIVSPRFDQRLSETIAGRRFLETLRQHHEEDKELETTEPNALNVRTASFFGPKQKETVNDLKRKRMTLRASLEELLVEYLRNLAPETDDSIEDRSRVKRSIRNIGSNAVAGSDYHLSHSVVNNVNNSSAQAEKLSVDNNSAIPPPSVLRESIDANTDDGDDVNNDDGTKNASSNSCPERRQRISQLDRNELNAALRNDSDYEHNIRRLLNYRCSGKNHCSFVYNNDHPFSILWPNGIVRIKYMCMEGYRMNKYCGEHLIIVNESPVPDPTYQPSPHQRSLPGEENDEENSIEQDGPIAEALIQSEQMLHHLKILKSSAPSESEYERRKAAAAAEKQSHRKGIYSQDFRVMKILPSNLDDFNDIEQIGDDIYFKKDEDEKTVDVDNSLSAGDTPKFDNAINIKNAMHSTESMKTDAVTKPGILDDTKIALENTFDISNNGLRDARSTLGYDEVRTNKLSTSHQTVAEPIPTLSSTAAQTSHTTKNLWDNEIIRQNANIFETLPVNGVNDIFDTLNELNQTSGKLMENNNSNNMMGTTANDFTVINTNRADIERREWESDEEYDASYEDYAVEVNGPKIERKNKIRVHTSYQKTAIRQPLLQQGFIASPGYPKYYIGNSNCSWRISVPGGQRIRLILLDVNLRYDPICKDLLQIVDVGSKRILFKNCTDVVKPMEILSETHELLISIKTKSVLAYPKRGILVYYTALGCILPSAPDNGQVVSQTDNSIKFLCDPSYVFPDTSENIRELTCTNRNTWDKSLPNCIEHSLVSSPEHSYVKSQWNPNRIGVVHKPDEQADALYDVLIPSLVIAGLFILNAFILLIIWRYRNKRKNRLQNDGLAQL